MQSLNTRDFFHEENQSKFNTTDFFRKELTNIDVWFSNKYLACSFSFSCSFIVGCATSQVVCTNISFPLPSLFLKWKIPTLSFQSSIFNWLPYCSTNFSIISILQCYISPSFSIKLSSFCCFPVSSARVRGMDGR